MVILIFVDLSAVTTNVIYKIWPRCESRVLHSVLGQAEVSTSFGGGNSRDGELSTLNDKETSFTSGTGELPH